MTPLTVERVPIGSLTPDPANVRLHDERNLEAVANSLRRFGQQKPIVVDAEGIVRAGNGTLAAAKRLGWSHIAIVRTQLRGAEAAAYAISDNRTGDLSRFDDDALRHVIAGLRDSDGIAPEEFGFDPAALAELMPDAETPRFEPETAGVDTLLDQKAAIRCPHCGGEFQPQ